MNSEHDSHQEHQGGEIRDSHLESAPEPDRSFEFRVFDDQASADVSSRDRAHGLARARGVDEVRSANPPIHVVFDQPVIPPNTGNAIRMCAGVGAHLHLCEPLGFTLEERHLRRAGLDYHDLADVTVHSSLDECFQQLGLGSHRSQGSADSSTPCSTSSSPSPSSASSSTSPTPPSSRRVFAFTARTETNFGDISFQWGDVFLFGCEPSGLDAETLRDSRISELVRIPMLPGRRSMNLSNAAAVAVYEGWRQLGYPGAAQ